MQVEPQSHCQELFLKQEKGAKRWPLKRRPKVTVVRFRARNSDCWNRKGRNTEWKVGNNRKLRLTRDQHAIG